MQTWWGGLQRTAFPPTVQPHSDSNTSLACATTTQQPHRAVTHAPAGTCITSCTPHAIHRSLAVVGFSSCCAHLKQQHPHLAVTAQLHAVPTASLDCSSQPHMCQSTGCGGEPVACRWPTAHPANCPNSPALLKIQHTTHTVLHQSKTSSSPPPALQVYDPVVARRSFIRAQIHQGTEVRRPYPTCTSCSWATKPWQAWGQEPLNKSGGLVPCQHTHQHWHWDHPAPHQQPSATAVCQTTIRHQECPTKIGLAQQPPPPSAEAVMCQRKVIGRQGQGPGKQPAGC